MHGLFIYHSLVTSNDRVKLARELLCNILLRIFINYNTRMIALPMQGARIQEYIIEITILPFIARVPAHPHALQLHPFYENEEGRCYLRMIASVHLVSGYSKYTCGWSFWVLGAHATRRCPCISM